MTERNDAINTISLQRKLSPPRTIFSYGCFHTQPPEVCRWGYLVGQTLDRGRGLVRIHKLHFSQVDDLTAFHKEGWAPKNWCFRAVVLKKTLESPLDCKRSNQSILKEISPDCSLEGLMLKLKLQCFGLLMWRADSLEKTLMLGKIEGRRRRRWQRMRLVGWHHRHNGLWQLVIDRRPGVLRFMGLQRVGHNWMTELNWTSFSFRRSSGIKARGMDLRRR